MAVYVTKTFRQANAGQQCLNCKENRQLVGSSFVVLFNIGGIEMKFRKKITILMFASLVLPMVIAQSGHCRGGFGGGGGGRGFGGGGGFDRGGFGGDFDRGGIGGFDRGMDRGIGGMDRGGDAFDRFNDNFDHPGDSAFGGNNTGIKAGDDGVRSFGDAGRALAGDGGFGHVMDNPGAGWAGRAGTYNTSPRAFADRYNAVNGNFNHWNYFNHGWWNNHPGIIGTDIGATIGRGVGPIGAILAAGGAWILLPTLSTMTMATILLIRAIRFTTARKRSNRPMHITHKHKLLHRLHRPCQTHLCLMMSKRRLSMT